MKTLIISLSFLSFATGYLLEDWQMKQVELVVQPVISLSDLPHSGTFLGLGDCSSAKHAKYLLNNGEVVCLPYFE